VLQQVLVGLGVASAVELLILRTFTRAAIHIPALQPLAGPYEFLSGLGRYSYYVAAVLLIVAIPVLAVALWRSGAAQARVAAASVVAFAAAAGMARLGLLDRFALDTLTVGAVLLLAAASPGAVNRRAAVMMVAFAGAFALTSSHTILQAAREDGLGSWDGRWLLWAGELAALAFAISTPFVLRVAPSRRVAIAAAVVGAFTFALFLGNASTTKILLLWNEGLAGSFPAVAYAVAAGALCAVVAALAGQGRMVAAVGLALLIIGGFGLHSTYQTGLVVAGLAAFYVACLPPGSSRPAGIGGSPGRSGEANEYGHPTP
jgi:hypothetical protein